jgi:hypothetical protein
MWIDTYAHITAEPVRFPDEVALIYREADRETQVLTGRAFKMQPQPWSTIRQRLPMAEYYLVEVEGYLREGKSANLGFTSVGFEFVEEQ